MGPSARSSQCSSISVSADEAPGLALPTPAGTNFSSGCCVSVGNEILADGVLLSDIASIALGELNSGSPSFLVRIMMHGALGRFWRTRRRGKPRLYSWSFLVFRILWIQAGCGHDGAPQFFGGNGESFGWHLAIGILHGVGRDEAVASSDYGLQVLRLVGVVGQGAADLADGGIDSLLNVDKHIFAP